MPSPGLSFDLNALNLLPDAVFVAREGDGAIIHTNIAAEELYGYQANEFENLGFGDLSVDAGDVGFPGAGMDIVDFHEKKNGDRFPVTVRSETKTISGKPVSVITVRDVSDELSVHNNLAEKEERYRNLAELSTDGIIVTVDKKIAYANNAVISLCGYKPAEMLGRDVMEICIHPEGAEKLEEYYQRRKKGDQSVFCFESRVLRKDGDFLDVEIKSRPIEYEGKKAALINLRDISHRKEMEESLRKEKSFVEKIIETAPVIVLVLSENGEILKFNPRFEALTGYSLEDVKGKSWFDIFIPEPDRSRIRRIFSLTVDKVNTSGINNPILTSDGRLIEVQWYNSPLRNDGDEIVGVLSIGQDITERRKYENDLARIGKLESIGVLAGGIAHDFNNLLASILLSVSFVKEELAEDGKSFEAIGLAIKGCHQAKNLSTQLLTFSRGGTPVIEEISLDKVIQDACDFALRGSNCSCAIELENGLSNVMADEGQVHQVVSNLVINSDQAMPQGGFIELRARNVDVDESSNVPLKPGSYVRVDVQDEGTGIPRNNLDRVFDPFFTTKQKGSGLGLATVFSIVNKHGGHTAVESQAGNGSTFTFYLPAAEKTVETGKPVKEASSAGSGLRVLIMDDQEVVRRALSEMLEKKGYIVAQAEHGEKAVEMFALAVRSGEPYHVVILDLTVPGGMGGVTAVKHIKDIDPDIPAIAASGYSNDPVMSDYADYGFDASLAKPFGMAELTSILDRLIASRKTFPR